MKKLILIVLLSLVLSEKNKCKPNEIYKEEEKSCVEICKKDEYFNTETSTCEKCDEGQKYNQDKKECEDIKKQCKSNETWNDKMKRCVRNVIKCRNGRIERGRCRCNGGYRWVNGECRMYRKLVKKTCPAGQLLVGNKCEKKKIKKI